MNCASVATSDDAYRAVARKEADLAMLHSNETGITECMILGDREIPEELQQLPGFREIGVSGIPGPKVCHFVVAQTPDEIKQAIS